MVCVRVVFLPTTRSPQTFGDISVFFHSKFSFLRSGTRINAVGLYHFILFSLHLLPMSIFICNQNRHVVGLLHNHDSGNSRSSSNVMIKFCTITMSFRCAVIHRDLLAFQHWSFLDSRSSCRLISNLPRLVITCPDTLHVQQFFGKLTLGLKNECV